MKKSIVIMFGLLFSSVLFADNSANVGVVGLQDFKFGTVTQRDTDIVSTQKVCVFSKGSGNYELRFTAGNDSTPNQLYISDGMQKIPATLLWNGQQLQPNGAAIKLSGASRNVLSNCPGNEGAVEVKLILQPQKGQRLTAGNYNLDMDFYITHLD